MSKLFLPALFSFQDKHGQIDRAATQNYLRYLTERGVKGFYVNGSTGEAFLLSLEARMRVLEIVREEVPSDSLLIAQIGCISTRESVKLAQHAEKVGVDAVSAITPFYYKFSGSEILAHYAEIMKSVDLPFCPYHFPKLSGVELSREEWNILLSNPQVQYLKFTSSDLYTLQRLAATFPHVTILSGFDEMILSGLAAGAKGGIGSSYNFTFPTVARLAQALKAGDIETARAHQNTINIFIDLLSDVGVWQAGKYLFDKFGVASSAPLPPFASITDANKKIVDDFCQKHPEVFEYKLLHGI